MFKSKAVSIAVFVLTVLLGLVFVFSLSYAHANAGVTQEAKFVKEGTFRNCEVGQLSWQDNDEGWTRSTRYVNVVICKDTTNFQYQSGKFSTHAAIIQERQAIEKAKKEKALIKLTEEEKRLLGLK